jgi:hypothetical protein
MFKTCFYKITPPGFGFLLGVFVVNQLIEARGIYIPYVHAYLDDLIAVPIMMSGMLMFQQQLTYRKPSYTFSIWHIVFMVALLSWYFEWYAPGRKANHFADIIDVVAYAIGGVVFYFWQNKPARGWVYFNWVFPYLIIVPHDKR